MAHNTTYITVLTRNDGLPAGKTYDHAGKHVAHHTGIYTAQRHTLTGDADAILAGYLAIVEGLNHAQSMILGHVAQLGDMPYQVRPKKTLSNLKGVTMIGGVPYIPRLKHHFTPSLIQLLDFDPDEAMPPVLRETDNTGRWERLCQAIPEFAGSSRVTIPSGSGRVLGADGKPYKEGGGSHTYICLDQDITSDALDNMRTALTVRLWANDLGFIKLSKKGAKLRRTLFDSSVLVSGREVFDGPPCAKDPYTLGPLVALTEQGGFAKPVTLPDTHAIKRFEKKTGAKVETSQRKGETIAKLVITDYSSLQMDTVIKTEQGEMTVAQFMQRGCDKLRCQATFRESSSWAGVLRKVGHGVILHDTGTGTTYKLLAPVTSDKKKSTDKLKKAIKQVKDQATARTVILNQLWRVPLQLPLASLVAQIVEHDPQLCLDADDLRSYAQIMLEGRGACEAVTIAGALPNGVRYRQARDILEIEQAILSDLNTIHIVKAPHKAGKTQGLLRPMALSHECVAAISPRISLSKDLAKRLELGDYQTDIASSRLAICLNSIISSRFAHSLHRAHCILVDEISKCIKECHTNKSTLKQMAKPTWDKLVTLIKHAKLAVLVDADISSIDIEILASEGLQFTVWEIVETKRKLTGEFTNVDTVLANIKRDIADGLRCYIASDSATLVAKLQAQITTEHPEHNTIAIHSKEGSATTGESVVVQLVSDIDKHIVKVDNLIVSPAIESGLSLNVQHFNRYYAIYGGYVEPAAFNQMLLRDRTATHWQIGISGHGKHDLPISYEHALNNLDATQRLTESVIPDFDDDFEPVVTVRPCTAYDEYCCKIAIANNKARNFYAGNLFQLLEHRGWTVKRSDAEPSQAGRDYLDQARMTFEVEQLERLVTAPAISKEDATQLRTRYALTTEESATLCKYDIAETVVVEVDAVTVTEIEYYQDGRLKGHRKLFDGLHATGVSQRDIQDFLADTAPALRTHETVRNRAARALFEALGLSCQTGDGILTRAHAKQAFDALATSEHAGALEHLGICRFDTPVTESNAIRWASDALAKFGLWLELVKRGGADGRDGRSYQLGRGAKRTINKRTGEERFQRAGWDLMMLFHRREWDRVQAQTLKADRYWFDETGGALCDGCIGDNCLPLNPRQWALCNTCPHRENATSGSIYIQGN